MNAMTPTPFGRDAILRLPEVLEIVRVAKATLYRRISEGKFPKPCDLGGRAVGWRRSEVDEWIENRPRAGPL